MAKRKTPIEKLSVNVTAERRPEFPRRIMRLDVEFIMDGTGVERDHAERAIQLSFERYCSVASSLAPDIVMEARLTLNGESGSPMRQKIWRPTI
jgi:putative redox protein